MSKHTHMEACPECDNTSLIMYAEKGRVERVTCDACRYTYEVKRVPVAAAPELLAALQDAIACLECRIRGAVINGEPDRIGKMRQAIAKAEG